MAVRDTEKGDFRPDPFTPPGAAAVFLPGRRGPVADPRQEEALCRWAVVNYVGKKYGGHSGELPEAENAEMTMRENVSAALTPGSPLERFDGPEEYETVVCGRGTA